MFFLFLLLWNNLFNDENQYIHKECLTKHIYLIMIFPPTAIYKLFISCRYLQCKKIYKLRLALPTDSMEDVEIYTKHEVHITTCQQLDVLAHSLIHVFSTSYIDVLLLSRTVWLKLIFNIFLHFGSSKVTFWNAFIFWYPIAGIQTSSPSKCWFVCDGSLTCCLYILATGHCRSLPSYPVYIWYVLMSSSSTLYSSMLVSNTGFLWNI